MISQSDERQRYDAAIHALQYIKRISGESRPGQRLSQVFVVAGDTLALLGESSESPPKLAIYAKL